MAGGTSHFYSFFSVNILVRVDSLVSQLWPLALASQAQAKNVQINFLLYGLASLNDLIWLLLSNFTQSNQTRYTYTLNELPHVRCISTHFLLFLQREKLWTWSYLTWENYLFELLFWVKQPFETVFQSISGHFPERGRICLRKSEETFLLIKFHFVMSLKNLVDYDIHCLSCSYTNDVIDMLP